MAPGSATCWRKGRCLAYAQASFSALADAIKADARILDDDAPATATAKLEARVAELGAAAADPDLFQAVEALLVLVRAAVRRTADCFGHSWPEPRPVLVSE